MLETEDREKEVDDEVADILSQSQFGAKESLRGQSSLLNLNMHN